MTLNFDAQDYPYASKRHVVYARNGMCNAGNPHAASAGLQVLLKGGNAVDAAVAMASAMPVVEPTGNGIGADCFAIVWFKGRMYGLNASGPAPMANSVAALKARGHEKIPSYGVEPIDVPGCVGGWAALHERFGSMPLEEVMAPAIRYAEEGYPVTPNISRLWEEAFNIYSKYRDRPEFKGWFDTFAPNGTWLKPGEMFRSPDMAATLREIAATKGESFYRGAIADKIDAFFKAHNGFLTKEDLAAYRPEWVEPISVNYRGYDVWELPPNGHGITVLMALGMLNGLTLPEKREDADYYHKVMEAIKLAFADTKTYVADPRYMKTKVSELLSPDYLAARRALITDKALEPKAGDPHCGGTIYLCTADAEGNMVSLIQSNYCGFGAGIAIPGTGISLQDRGANFSLDPKSDNYLEGGKKSYHTIIPGFLLKDGEAVGPFGVMGAFMQPQGQVEVLTSTIDYAMNPQEALDAPRIQWIGGKKLQIEREAGEAIAEQLRAMGHEVEIVDDRTAMGRGEIIWKCENGVYAAGTEPRCDGTVASW